jgi:aspartyl-tRNA(Asn)/glutamyl-tRNA(Gln) amidotransferase subunit B
MLRELKERKLEPAALEADFPASRLAALVALVETGKLSSSAAKEVFVALWGNDEEPATAAERLGLIQVSDTALIETWVREVIQAHQGPVEQYRAGKVQTLGFLVGQVMKRSGGRAQPPLVQQLLREALERP